MDQSGLLVLALLVMGVGLLGTIIPGIPGVPLIWLAAAAYGVVDGFQHLSLVRLGLLTIIALVGVAAQHGGSLLLARAGGASGRAALAGSCLAVIGLVFFTVPLALLLALLGVFGIELHRGQAPGRAALGSAGWLVGWGLSFVVEFLTALAVIALFLQAVLS